MSNKLEILDSIIDIEDSLESEAMQQIPSLVTERIKELYGEYGVTVCNTYYKKSDSVNETDDCPECAEKAKKLINLMKLSQTVSDSLIKDEVDSIYHKLKDHDDIINDTLKRLRLILSESDHLNDNLLKMSLIKWLVLN